MRSKLKDQIRALMFNKVSEDVYYYDSKYHVVRDSKEIKISKNEAVKCLRNGTLWHLIEDKRTFDLVSWQWIGSEPVHVIPAGLPKCEVQNITMLFPCSEFVRLFGFI